MAISFQCQLFITCILTFSIPILSQGFKEHGWPDDAVVIQKSMCSRRSFLFSLIAPFTIRILKRKAFLSCKPYVDVTTCSGC